MLSKALFSASLVLTLLCIAAPQAHAGWWIFGDHDRRDENQLYALNAPNHYYDGYYETPQWEHMALRMQQPDESWRGGDWYTQDGYTPAEMITRWKRADVLRGSGRDWQGVTYVVAGPNFYHLSAKDQQRVALTLDQAYNYTSERAQRFRFRDWCTDKIVGEYSTAGLFLQ